MSAGKLALILAGKPAEDGEEDGKDGEDLTKAGHDAAAALIEAIHAKNLAAVWDALVTAAHLADEMPHEEGPEEGEGEEESEAAEEGGAAA